MKDETFNITRFKNSKKKFEFSGSVGTTKNLFEKIRTSEL